MINLAINGYGRIGRNIVRALYESGQTNQFRIIAINDLGDITTNAHLTRFDTMHGRFLEPVETTDKGIKIRDDLITAFSESAPQNLPWEELDIDIVLECSGAFPSKEACQSHLKAGAKKVLISSPAKGVDATVVYGVNETILSQDMQVVSNASCTTNCLAPMAKLLSENIGIEQGMMTTIHAYTNDQVLTDVHHADLYRARAAALNMIPTKTGAAEAVGLVIPELLGRFSGMSVRVPTANVSLVDLTFLAPRKTNREEVNEIIRLGSEQPVMDQVLCINEQPLVSMDFNHSPYSSNFDATQTKVQDRLVKVMSWYDNEWAFAMRMLDTAKVMAKL